MNLIMYDHDSIHYQNFQRLLLSAVKTATSFLIVSSLASVLFFTYHFYNFIIYRFVKLEVGFSLELPSWDVG